MKRYIKTTIQPVYTLADWIEQHKNDAIDWVGILDATDNSPEDKLDEDFLGGRTIFEATMSELVSGEMVRGKGHINNLYPPYESYEVVKEQQFGDNYELIVERLY